MVASDKYADFLANEGRVLMTLRAAPHRNLPTLIGCQDPGASADTESGFLFFNPMFGDLYAEARAPRYVHILAFDSGHRARSAPSPRPLHAERYALVEYAFIVCVC